MAIGIQISSEQVASAASSMNGTLETMQSQIAALNTSVSGLFMPGGGLYLLMTSPAMTTLWESFQTALQNGANQVTTFTTQFDNIVQNMLQFDSDTASKITSSASS
ncbi:hypothetical protein KDK95_16310 [Actinospica sp. MGRD01-02]|uniref:Uncharacterized protein n=1 Tax=Actinospica acidithermotolerans TaxID=2828514 RepID=A0A941ECE9_9ACTN|nr:hypothetical protein [Actinospica acidithermotolerans]MBR7827883.1 hypothetical protein [Actinospica acidithermotolerans]